MKLPPLVARLKTVEAILLQRIFDEVRRFDTMHLFPRSEDVFLRDRDRVDFPHLLTSGFRYSYAWRATRSGSTSRRLNPISIVRYPS